MSQTKCKKSYRFGLLVLIICVILKLFEKAVMNRLAHTIANWTKKSTADSGNTSVPAAFVDDRGLCCVTIVEQYMSSSRAGLNPFLRLGLQFVTGTILHI